MKIVDLPTLLAQPVGTLFAPYGGPGNIAPLARFGGSVSQVPGNLDFTCATLDPFFADLPAGHHDWATFWTEVMEHGGQAPFDPDCWGRNGLHDPRETFVLLDREDVLRLVRALTKDLVGAYGIDPSDLLPSPTAP